MSEVIELKDISDDPQKLEAAVQQVVDSLPQSSMRMFSRVMRLIARQLPICTPFEVMILA
jgi:hypothetical protein